MPLPRRRRATRAAADCAVGSALEFSLVGFSLGRPLAGSLLAGLLARLDLLLLLLAALPLGQWQRVAQVPKHRPSGVLGLAEAELHPLVSIVADRFHLRDDTRTSLDDRDGNHGAVGAEDLGHAHLAA